MRLFAIGILTAFLTAAATAAQDDTERARALLEDVGAAYRSAPTLSDTLTLDFDGEQNTMRLRFGKDNTRIQFDVPGFAVMAIDGYLMVTSEDVPQKYMKTKIEGTVSETLVSVFGAPESVPFHFVMRENRGVDTYLNSMTIGFLQEPKISGFTPAGEGDNTHHIISLSDGHGDAFVHVDPATNLISKIRVSLPPMPGMSDEEIKAVITMNPTLADELEDKIEFDPGDREVVESPEQLVPQMVAVGDPAPDFTLPTLDGENVSLSDLRGNIVVLDFWATWCVPCIRALPEVEKFAEWVKEEGLPVKVYAVNVWEHRGNTLDERKQIAGEFWNEREFKLTNLLDYDDSFINSLAIDSIPTTLIIDGAGKVHEIHVGYSQHMFDLLKEIVTKAVEEGAAAAAAG